MLVRVGFIIFLGEVALGRRFGVRGLYFLPRYTYRWWCICWLGKRLEVDSRWFGERSERSVETPHVGGRSSRNVRIEMRMSVRSECWLRMRLSVRSESCLVRIVMSVRSERSSVVRIESVRNERSSIVRIEASVRNDRSVVRIGARVRNERSSIVRIEASVRNECWLRMRLSVRSRC